jgi:hypothetical protein
VVFLDCNFANWSNKFIFFIFFFVLAEDEFLFEVLFLRQRGDESWDGEAVLPVNFVLMEEVGPRRSWVSMVDFEARVK